MGLGCTREAIAHVERLACTFAFDRSSGNERLRSLRRQHPRRPRLHPDPFAIRRVRVATDPRAARL